MVKKLNILFVCTGNINRSPAAEIILKSITDEFNVDSAAITKTNNGKKTTKRMIEVLRNVGFKATPLISKQITFEMINWADIIFYMQPSHVKSLNKMFLGNWGQSNKLRPLAELSHRKRFLKIEDPHFSKRHKESLDQLIECINNFIILGK